MINKMGQKKSWFALGLGLGLGFWFILFFVSSYSIVIPNQLNHIVGSPVGCPLGVLEGVADLKSTR